MKPSQRDKLLWKSRLHKLDNIKSVRLKYARVLREKRMAAKLVKGFNG